MVVGKYLPEANPGPAEDVAVTIKTLYENNANTNEFSDAEQTKLAGIATGADVTGSNAPQAHTIASHSDTTGTGAELETLTDGSETALHSHAAGAIWTLLETLSPSAVTTISSSTLDVHDLWMVIVDLIMTDNSERTFSVRLNGDSGSNYWYRNLDSTSILIQNATTILALGTSLDNYPLLGCVFIGGKSKGDDGFVGAWGGVTGRHDYDLMTNGGYNAAADITSMTFLIAAETFTGKIKIFYMDY